MLICLILLSAFAFSACAPQPVRIEGTAMLPNFSDGDKILMDKNVVELKRGDVIMFLYPKDRTKSYFKRIIGLPGETIEIKAGKTYINGEVLEETYLDEQHNQAKPTFPPRKIDNYQYFVMGDNRDNSSDSRYWGTVDQELITGRYLTTYSKEK